MSYQLLYASSVAKDLKALPASDRARVVDCILSLAENPRPNGVETLKGRFHGVLRVRVGGYRIVYRVEAEVVRIVKVDKRGRIYKRL